MDLAAEIAALKVSRRAVVLAHNYCRGDVQDVADYTGDSLELARRACALDAEVIVLCGVKFMAETAKILNPVKKVLIPDASAGCPMADMIDAAALDALKARHPRAKAVCYVNSTAETKAGCDMCVTSGNAEKVMRTFGADEEILFVPDRNLGAYVAGRLGRSYELWNGCCPIHEALTVAELEAAKKEAPGAPVLVHPECNAAVRAAADQCLSTGGMCAFARESACETIIVGTEQGILHRLRKENPTKRFVAAGNLVCADMKKTTLEKLRDALRDLAPEVTVDEAVAAKARKAVEAMLAVA